VSRVPNSDRSTQYHLDCLLAKLDCQISSAGSVITRLKTYADNSPVHLILDQNAAKAAALPAISQVGVSYSDTTIQYHHDILYCQIALPNLQGAIYLNESHDIWHMARILQCAWRWLNCTLVTLLSSICVRGYRFPVQLKITADEWFEALPCIILKIQLRLFILR